MTAAGIAATPRSFDVAAVASPASLYTYTITGVTRDASGNPLGNCAVVLLRTADNSVAAQMVSDASGNYSFAASPALQHKADAYLAGSPDVFGTTLNTLVGS